MKEDLFRGTEPRILSTYPHYPENGRTFVQAWTEWFERLEGDSGAVTFALVAKSEPELKHRLKANKCERDLVEIKGEFPRDVPDEFLEQVPLYLEALDFDKSGEKPFREHLSDKDIETTL